MFFTPWHWKNSSVNAERQDRPFRITKRKAEWSLLTQHIGDCIVTKNVTRNDKSKQEWIYEFQDD